jgi:starch-binding outer membrane protein, SusD/RagB family
MNNNKFLKASLLGICALSTLAFSSCGKLDPETGGAYSIVAAQAGVAPTAPDLVKLYDQLNQFVSQENWFAMSEHSTDELMGPTRGTDWDDFGTWRKLHQHNWTPTHNQVNNTWNGLQIALFQSTLLSESPSASASDKNAAKFLRAFFSYIQVDLFGQLQYRPATAAINEIPKVYTRSEAIDYIITELNSVIPNLPNFSTGTRNRATREAAQFLLAKCLLNKAVFKAPPSSPAGPYSFAPADMTQVISLCNSIASNSALSLDPYYWDNFTWQAGTNSSENIFVRNENINMVWATCMGNHYSMSPDGWNGFTTLSDFYNSFEANDMRKSDSVRGPITLSTTDYPNADPSLFYSGRNSSYRRLTGRNAGFLIGQQQGPGDKKIGSPVVNLNDRGGSPLLFTPDVPITLASESKGIRTNKYPLNPLELNGGGWGSSNEFVFMRFADVRLMKAEALLRGGTDTQAENPLTIVNPIRVLRNASPLSSVTLTNLLAERGRELYLEGHRRNDLIRFGKFNDPVQQRPTASPATVVVYPIPSLALSSNPNLVQNPGY